MIVVQVPPLQQVTNSVELQQGRVGSTGQHAMPHVVDHVRQVVCTWKYMTFGST
jgi:hypothetical protein